MSMDFLKVVELRGSEGVLVVSVVEGAVSNSDVSSGIVSVRVFLLALEQGQRRGEVSFLEEMGPVRQLQVFLQGER